MVDRSTIERRCGDCHTDAFRYGRHHHPSGADHRETLGSRVNYTHPEKSLLLRAPLAKSAGGLELCRQRKAARFPGKETENWRLEGTPAVVFAGTQDPDYRAMLKQIQEAAARYVPGRNERPGFVPHHDWVREMKRNGVLPEAFEPDGSHPLQFYFDVDAAYYALFHHEASPAPVYATGHSSD
jgi:hypothetical protein